MSSSKRPSDLVPEVYDAVAEATYHLRQATDILKGDNIAPKFGISQQAFDKKVHKHADKVRNTNGSIKTAPVAMEEEVSGR